MLQTGEVLNNRYRIVKLLGTGGFGSVYKAWDLNLETHRALKENLDTSLEAQRQFKREAQTLDKLSHPNLPKVIDHSIIPGKGQYLVMEYVEGEDLQQMLDRIGGPILEHQVLTWIQQVCDALSYLHSQKPPIIHRDIKPANIKVTPEGKVMLVDFGIAKIFDPVLSTTVGARAVTPGYSPYEQYGQGKTDQRTDIYALGATLYTLLTGQVPVESIQRVFKDPLVPPEKLNPAISPTIAKAIQQALQNDPEKRPPTTENFKDILKAQIQVPSTLLLPQHDPTLTIQTERVITEKEAPLTSNHNYQSIKKWLPSATVFLVAIILTAIFLPEKPATQATSTATEAQLLAFVVDTSTLRPSETETVIPSLTFSPLPLLPSATLSPSPLPPSLTPLPPTPTNDPSIQLPCTHVGQTWRSPVDGMVLSCIPAGEFLMGSKEEDSDAYDEEFPQHTVYLNAYWMDQTEVTNAMYQKCVSANECDRPSNTDYFNDTSYSNHPVIYVSWYQAEDYCAWAERRLSTEAEWEKAARGENGLIYPWGNYFECSKGNFDDETVYDNYIVPGGEGCDRFNSTAPVGSFESGMSVFGLFDMAGNVGEWVMDWFQSDYYAFSPYINPEGPDSGEYRVLRGGSWGDFDRLVRSAFRHRVDPVNTYDLYGFRCARSP